MLKISGLLLVLSLLFFPVAAQETVFSGNINSSSGYIDVEDDVIDGFYPEFSTENLDLNISKSDREIQDLNIYGSYNLQASEGSGISLRLVLENKGFEEWTEENGFEHYHYNIITGQNAVMTLNKTEEGYTSRIIIPEDEAAIHIAGSEQLYEDYQTAVNPEGTFCGLYWRPPDNHTLVEDCRGQLDEGFSLPMPDSSKIFAALGIVVLIILALIFYRKKDKNERDLEEITEEIIEKMESGELPKDKELLDKLEKANQKAYEDEYGEASELLEEVESELERKS